MASQLREGTEFCQRNERKSNRNKELNIVKWSDYDAKYDIREWNPDHTRMSKGLTFTEEELRVLHALIEDELKQLDSEK